MSDQSTLAVVIGFLCAIWISFTLISAIWKPDFVDHDSTLSIVGVFQVDINSAEWPEIAALPDIGPTRAQQIVQWRETQGPLTSIDDVAKIYGIGPATLQTIEPYLRWDKRPKSHVDARPPFPIESPGLDQSGQ